jgi:hypothetical protein
MEGKIIMNSNSPIATQEISDADLDNVSGGVLGTVQGVVPTVVGTVVGTVEGVTGLNTDAVTGLLPRL